MALAKFILCTNGNNVQHIEYDCHEENEFNRTYITFDKLGLASSSLIKIKKHEYYYHVYQITCMSIDGEYSCDIASGMFENRISSEKINRNELLGGTVVDTSDIADFFAEIDVYNEAQLMHYHNFCIRFIADFDELYF